MVFRGDKNKTFANAPAATLETAIVEMHNPDVINAESSYIKVHGADLQEVESDSKPIAIGSNPSLCDVVLEEEGVNAVHCFIYWNNQGVFIEPVNDSEFKLGGVAVKEPTHVLTSSEIEIKGVKLQVDFEGNIPARSQQLFPTGVGNAFALSYIKDVEQKPLEIDPDGFAILVKHAINIGRSSSCDLTLDDTSVSRDHAQLIPSGKTILMIDNYSSNGCYINLERVNKGRLYAGNIVEFGAIGFLVHYF
jgi:hypothetical protein